MDTCIVIRDTCVLYYYYFKLSPIIHSSVALILRISKMDKIDYNF